MKRWARRLGAAALFLLLAALFYRTAAYSLRPDDEGVRTRLEGFYGEESGSLDVVFVGSSAVYSFFSPLRLWKQSGLTSYLYATPNQTVPAIRYILEECRKTQPEALYVIELRSALASEEDKIAIENDLRRLSDNMPYSRTRSRMIAALAPRDEWASYEFDLAKYHGNWEGFDWSNLTFFWKKENPLKGWNFVSAYEPIEWQDWSSVNARIPLSEENEAELREVLAWCRDNGVRAVFTATPFALSRRQEKLYRAVSDLVEEYGYEFWDLNRCVEEIGLDFQTDYYDFRHTNTLGAVKCTEYLAKELSKYFAKNGISAKKRNEAQWAAWFEAYEPQEQASISQIMEKIKNGEAGS